MAGSRGKRSGSKSRGCTRTPVKPVPLAISDEISPADPSSSEVEKFASTGREVVPEQEEEMDQEGLVADEVNEAEKDFEIKMSDSFIVGCEDSDTNEADEQKIEEGVSLGATTHNVEAHNGEGADEGVPEEDEEQINCDVNANNSERTDDEDPEEDDEPTNCDVDANNSERTDEEDAEENEEPVNCASDNKDVSILEEQNSPEVITGVTNINEAVAAAFNEVVESMNEIVDSKEEPKEAEQPINCGPSENEDISGTENQNSPVMIAGMANNDGIMLASEHGLLETSTDNGVNNKEANEPKAEEPRITSPDNGVEKSVEESASAVDEVTAVAGEISRPKKKIVKKVLIKKKVARRVINEAKEQPSNGNGTGDSCLPGASDEVDNGREEQNSPLLITGVTDNDQGLLASEHGLLESFKENEENNKEANELISPTKNITKNLKKRLTMKKKVQGKAKAAKGQSSNGDNIVLEKNEEKKEVKPIVKANKKSRRKRNKKPQPTGPSGVQGASDEQNLKSTIDDSKCEENNKATEQEMSRLGSREDNAVEGGTQKVNAKDTEKPGSSKMGKSSKKIGSMGMVFMCSSETKKDCYKYKVLGLPAAKKDVVSKIYKGMRLFLFDVDLKMLYGIYKAASPGGYNVEPRAFRSQYPSQVRFTVLEDCLPIAEENFKRIIKDNYYTKNKFSCELTQEQVKNLCKLFHETSKKAGSIQGRGGQAAVASSSAVRGQKRKQVEHTGKVRGDQAAVPSSSAIRGEKRKRVEHTGKVGATSSRERERSRRRVHKDVRRAPVARVREEARHVPLVRIHEVRRAPVLRGFEEVRLAPIVRGHEEVRLAPIVRGHEEARHAPLVRGHEEIRLAPRARDHEEGRHGPFVIGERYRHPVILDRETYIPSVSYSYERSPGVEDIFRRDSARNYRDLELPTSREVRLPVERNHHDPYALYREPRLLPEREYGTDSRYSLCERYAERPRSPNHRPPPPLYRRY